jgi:hypothetical protein
MAKTASLKDTSRAWTDRSLDVRPVSPCHPGPGRDQDQVERDTLVSGFPRFSKQPMRRACPIDSISAPSDNAGSIRELGVESGG